MFLVTCEYALDGRDVDETDKELFSIACRTSDGSGAGKSSQARTGFRDHLWYVDTISEAKKLVRELNKVNGVKATLREK